jgi:hypothetical protein
MDSLFVRFNEMKRSHVYAATISVHEAFAVSVLCVFVNWQ